MPKLYYLISQFGLMLLFISIVSISLNAMSLEELKSKKKHLENQLRIKKTYLRPAFRTYNECLKTMKESPGFFRCDDKKQRYFQIKKGVEMLKTQINAIEEQIEEFEED